MVYSSRHAFGIGNFKGNSNGSAFGNTRQIIVCTSMVKRISLSSSGRTIYLFLERMLAWWKRSRRNWSLGGRVRNEGSQQTAILPLDSSHTTTTSSDSHFSGQLYQYNPRKIRHARLQISCNAIGNWYETPQNSKRRPNSRTAALSTTRWKSNV